MAALLARFGSYYLLDRINVGGMAEVFRAKPCDARGFARLVAVKRILSSLSNNAEFIEMFVNEAKLAVQLNHANIAQIFDLGYADGSYYIAMEYVPGKDMRAVFDACQPTSIRMPIAVVCHVMMKVCEGLEFAHNKRDTAGRPMGLVHRDVSPQNIILSYDGEVKLIDFGVAKASGIKEKTQAGVLKGKFAHMSPEQVRGLPLDRRSDIFSVGVILFEFLSGQRLFWGETDFSTLEQVRTADIPSVRRINPEIEESLERIVFRALAKDVDDRYQRAIDLHDDLQAYLFGSGLFAGNTDLADWLAAHFAADVRAEREKVQAYSNLRWHDVTSGLSARLADTLPGTISKRGSAGTVSLLSPSEATARPEPARDADPDDSTVPWCEEELDTQIFDRPATAAPAPHSPALLSEVLIVDGFSAPPEGQQGSIAVPLVEAESPFALIAPDADPAPASSRERASPPATLRRRLLTVVLLVVVSLLAVGVVVLALYLRDSTGSLRVSSAPGAGEIYLDGSRQSGKTPLTVHDLEPGVYVVSVRKRGFETWASAVEVVPGKTSSVRARLEKIPLTRLEVRSVPSGLPVTLDGHRLEGRTPLEVTRIVPGKHMLELRRSARHSAVRREVDLRPGQEASVLIELPDKVPLAIVSKPPGAVVLLKDDQGTAPQVLGRTPLSTLVEPLQGLSLIVRHARYGEWARPLTFDGGRPVQLSAVLERETRRR